MQQFTIIIPIVLLITAIFELDVGYWYYQLLRWGVFICAILSGYLNYQNKKFLDCRSSRSDELSRRGTAMVLIVFAIIAILFNPIAPIYFSKEIWKIIDGITVAIFLIVLFKNTPKGIFKP